MEFVVWAVIRDASCLQGFFWFLVWGEISFAFCCLQAGAGSWFYSWLASAAAAVLLLLLLQYFCIVLLLTYVNP